MTSRSRLGSEFLQRAGRGASLLLIGFLSVQVTRAAVTVPDVAVTGGRMQVLLPSRPAAGYFTLENHGGALVLFGASAPDCQSLMLHKSTEDNGMARMAMVTAVPVPPHGTLHFAPGGYHLMCTQPSGALLTHAGSETVTLHFADGGSVSAPFAIQGIGH
jgi:periplasmic copper chaperone A